MPALVAAGQTVAANADATQAQINAARDALRAAIAKVRIKPDRSPLLAALNAASPLNFSLYTDETAQTLNVLIGEARNLLSKQDEYITQAQIDALAGYIVNAIAGLAERPAAGGIVAPPAGSGAPVVPASPVAQGADALGTNGLIAASGTDGRIAGSGAGDVAGDAILSAPVPAGSGAADNAIGNGSDSDSDSLIEEGLVPQGAGDGASDFVFSMGHLIALAALVIAAGFIRWLVLAKRRKEGNKA
jgi:hypothetical protein